MTQETKKKTVREYLDALVWDGKPRLDRWLVTYAGATESPRTTRVSRRVLVGAVRRARQPGCRFDELLVLVAPQGTGKSEALRVLAVDDDWFSEDLPRDDKRFLEATAGKWIVEASELSASDLSDVEALKACLSQQADVLPRMPYQRQGASRLREFVIIGTANEIDAYLRDEADNRRLWPIQVKGFDLDRLRLDRDQLWAEAAVAEAAGEAIRFALGMSESVAAVTPSTGDDSRLRELATRLVAVGPKASHVSASECHDISEGLHTLLDDFEMLRSGITQCLQNTSNTRPGEEAVVLEGLRKSLHFLLERGRGLEESR